MPPPDRAMTRNPTRMDESVTGIAAVVPSDTVDLPFVTRALYVSVAGAVKVTMMDGSTETYPNLLAGRHPLRVTRVWQTGTTATGMIAED